MQEVLMKIIDHEKQILESEDDLMTFYSKVDENFLTEHADQIRANMAPKRVLRKKDNNEEIN